MEAGAGTRGRLINTLRDQTCPAASRASSSKFVTGDLRMPATERLA